ncbi:MAG: Peptidase T [Phycisphaerae bacterium]|nr:Peptidase T [Phycisphaerae bacterium]
MSTLLDRFLRYVKIETTADERSTTYPSTASQLELSKLLRDELKAIGAADVHMSDKGIVTATIPSTIKVAGGGAGAAKGEPPTIALFAHVDTSPEFTAKNVNPQVIRNYDGKDIVLPNFKERVIRTAESPGLAELKGKTIITTDGTTLLGADDKSGVAVVMTAAEMLLKDPSIPHGRIRVCFTCDEEIGHGVDHVDLKQLGADVGYTLDGEAQGIIDAETFSADLAVVTVTGINTHPSEGKGRMVNAIRILSDFISRLPWQWMSPETTDGRDGFMHPYKIEGGVPEASARILLRDFVTANLRKEEAILENIAQALRAEHPRAKIEIKVTEQYRNMADGLKKEPRAITKAVEAFRALGIEPKMNIVRGGTDGSRLTEKGLPTPNLATGMHNFHSPLEWACLEEMETAVKMLIELAKAWGK